MAEVKRTRSESTYIRSIAANRMDVSCLLDFAKAVQEQNVPHNTMIEAHQTSVGHLSTLSVRFGSTEELDELGRPKED